MWANRRTGIWFLLASTIVGCGGLVVPNGDGTQQALIQDATNGGSSGFYWQPPMVPSQPALQGTFAPGLSPVIEIDSLDPMTRKQIAVVATYIAVSNGNHYQVSWNTALFKLDPALIYSIRVSVGGNQVGVADVLLDHSNVDPNQYVSLANGGSLRIKFWLNGCAAVVCSADQCHVPGSCDPSSTKCPAPTARKDGTACDDGDACTQTDTCQAGACVGANSTCGGGGAGQPCMVNGDCQSGVCTMGVCQGSTSSCVDGKQDGDETDTDCGGSTCVRCTNLKKCRVNSDCSSGECASGVCLASTCSDLLKDGNETDTDCGGGTCPRCTDLRSCQLNQDCYSGVCNAGVCRVPTCLDAVKNGDETDTDCGGGTCSRCTDLKSCFADTDCQSGVCLMGVCQPLM